MPLDTLMNAFFHDLRFAFRAFRKYPGYTCAALVTLALGIGANTAIYSVIDGVLLHPIPFPEPDRLVALYQTGPHSTPFLEIRLWVLRGVYAARYDRQSWRCDY